MGLKVAPFYTKIVLSIIGVFR